MTTWEYLILFASVLVGGALAFLLKRRDDGLLGFALSFSGAYLLGIVFLLLLPILFTVGGPQIGLWILAGFIVQLLLEPLSRGIEHGHIHAIEYSRKRPWQVIQVMLGLCIHAFMEGLPLTIFPTLAEAHLAENGASLFWGIVLHKFPAAFALAILLIQSRVKPSVVVLCLFIFSTMSPLGSWLGTGLAGLREYYPPLLALVAGSFLHIATTILFESEDSRGHRFNWYKAGFVLLGFATAILSIVD